MLKFIAATLVPFLSTAALAGTVVGGGDSPDGQLSLPQAQRILSAVIEVNHYQVTPKIEVEALASDSRVRVRAIFDMQLTVPVHTLVFDKQCLFIQMEYENWEG